MFYLQHFDFTICVYKYFNITVIFRETVQSFYK